MNLRPNKITLRQSLRARRRQLSKQEQLKASLDLLSVIKPFLRPGVRHIALYTAMDGEINLTPIIHYCIKRRIKLYLPVINRFKPTLSFAYYHLDAEMTANKFGIPEPLHGQRIKIWQLNTVLLPLVGFDEQGARLGMGGGFYDRTFARAHQWPGAARLFGVAHECQKVECIPTDSWDINLSGVLTNKKAYLA